jgi:hypothetical protein
LQPEKKIVRLVQVTIAGSATTVTASVERHQPDPVPVRAAIGQHAIAQGRVVGLFTAD